MEELKEDFDKYIELKNKEITELYNNKLKNKKTTNIEEIPDNIEKIDINTKKTYSKILAEQDRKYKSSKAYKKLQECIV